MVFFTCDGCNETLKKNQVDAHVYRCRQGCESVSCVDCGISFYGGTLMDYVGYRISKSSGGAAASVTCIGYFSLEFSHDEENFLFCNSSITRAWEYSKCFN